MPSFVSVIGEDIRGMVVDRGGGRLGYALAVLLKLLLYPSGLASASSTAASSSATGP